MCSIARIIAATTVFVIAYSQDLDENDITENASDKGIVVLDIGSLSAGLSAGANAVVFLTNTAPAQVAMNEGFSFINILS